MDWIPGKSTVCVVVWRWLQAAWATHHVLSSERTDWAVLHKVYQPWWHKHCLVGSVEATRKGEHWKLSLGIGWKWKVHQRTAKKCTTCARHKDFWNYRHKVWHLGTHQTNRVALFVLARQTRRRLFLRWERISTVSEPRTGIDGDVSHRGTAKEELNLRHHFFRWLPQGFQVDICC